MNKEALEELEQLKKEIKKAEENLDVALVEELMERKWRIVLNEL